MTIFESEAAPEQAELGLIWAGLLGSRPATETEDFFAAGGDSIGAAALVARVIDRLAVDLSLEAFLAEPTLAALGRLVADATPAPADSEPLAVDDPAPCSYAQERFWFIDQASGSNVVSNVSLGAAAARPARRRRLRAGPGRPGRAATTRCAPASRCATASPCRWSRPSRRRPARASDGRATRPGHRRLAARRRPGPVRPQRAARCCGRQLLGSGPRITCCTSSPTTSSATTGPRA